MPSPARNSRPRAFCVLQGFYRSPFLRFCGARRRARRARTRGIRPGGRFRRALRRRSTAFFCRPLRFCRRAARCRPRCPCCSCRRRLRGTRLPRVFLRRRKFQKPRSFCRPRILTPSTERPLSRRGILSTRMRHILSTRSRASPRAFRQSSAAGFLRSRRRSGNR